MSEGDERESFQPEPPAIPAGDRGVLQRVFVSDSRLRPIWRFVVAGLLAYGVNYIAGGIAFTALQGHPMLADATYRALALVILAGCFRLLLELLDEEQGDPWVSMGLPRGKGALRDALLGMLIGSGMIALAVAAMATLGHFSPVIHFSSASVAKLIAVTLGLLFGAMLEEMMFRGYPFQRLIESFGAAWAVLVLSALFGAVHFFNPHNGGPWSWEFLDTLAVGVLLAVAYLRTRSLWMPFGIHFAWNFALGVVMGLPVSGLKDFGVVVHTTVTGPRWITGGAYGLEGSVTGVVVILVGFIPLLWFTRKHGGAAGANFPQTGI